MVTPMSFIYIDWSLGRVKLTNCSELTKVHSENGTKVLGGETKNDVLAIF